MSPGEREVVGQPRSAVYGSGQRLGDLSVVIVVVVGFCPVRNVDAGNAGKQIVDVVVAAEFSIGDDVQAG